MKICQKKKKQVSCWSRQQRTLHKYHPVRNGGGWRVVRTYLCFLFEWLFCKWLENLT